MLFENLEKYKYTYRIINPIKWGIVKTRFTIFVIFK